jgi:hypothetical protein
MPLKIADFPASVLPYKIIYESSLTNSPLVDVTGSSGTLYYVHVDNTGGVNNYSAKMWLSTASFTLGTSNPEVMFKVPSGQSVECHFPGGIAFSALSAVLVDSNTDAGTAITTTGNNSTPKLTLLTS